MKIITNEKLIQRNAKIGQYSTLAGLAILFGGMFVSLRLPENYFSISLATLFVGFVLSQIGFYYSNRWARRPRPDEAITDALNGLDDRYSLYHYTSPVPHLLLASGLWLLEPYYQGGKIVYQKGRWKNTGGGFFQAYLRIFAQEGLGRPDLDVAAHQEALQKFFDSKLADAEFPPPLTLLVFTHKFAKIEADEAPFPALLAKEIKDHIRKTGKGKLLTNEQVKKIQQALEG